MEWWVITDFNISKTSISFRPSLTTNVPAHLFMTWDYTKPTRIPIWRTIRGVLKLCGYAYKWDSPNIEEQEQPGDSGLHTFPVTGLETHPYPRWVWFYFHSPLANEGNQCQSPLMSVVLPVTFCAPLWEFFTDLQGWTPTLGDVQWVNDGDPFPGCIQFSGPTDARAYSPGFDSSWASRIDIELELKHPLPAFEFLVLSIYKAGLWYTLDQWNDPALPWTHQLVLGAEAYKSAETYLQLSKIAAGTWRADTICVRLYP